MIFYMHQTLTLLTYNYFSFLNIKPRVRFKITNRKSIRSDNSLAYKGIRGSFGLEPGPSFEVLLYNNRIELTPKKPMNKLKGMLRGIDTNIIRDDDRV